ncbi:molybdenum cofactor synthesis domain-containing protein [Pseudonocardia thermophila]|uniref:Molybdopterin molybdenumtransferase n=1 Tax=Pseudonocardia thermophila TaxID=1848 RepID=A0A1M6Q488_PSETH|nr:molybdopterin-binding protein [Pseudonocardia thermophila]SHK15059.1 molybdenum cofactor synthesis domain-containing protein [Pseudonocardia thermophila]
MTDAADAVRADPVAEAFRSWLRGCARAGWAPDAVVETVGVRQAHGRVTAGPVVARWPVPVHDETAYDETMPSPIGDDVRTGSAVLPGGHRIRPVDVAALAAAGHVSITVRRRPRVAIVPTGDEVRPFGGTPRPSEVLDTNSLMLEGLLAEAGCEPWPLPVVPDRPDALAAALSDAAPTADLVLVVAGSRTARDAHLRAVIAQLGQVAVHRVAMRPGRPVVLGVLGGGAPEHDPVRPAMPPVPVVGVPGYPASVERVFRGFVAPLLHRILGVPPPARHPVPARLAAPVRSTATLDEHVRVRVATVTDPGTAAPHLLAVPLPRGAGALTALIRAEALLHVPVGVDRLAAGAAVQLLTVPGAAFATSTTVLAGPSSPAVDALVDAHRADTADCVLHRTELGEDEALSALAAGLCHAAVAALPLGAAYPDAAQRLADRLGAITALEVARSDRVDVLVVPAAAFDSAPVVRLRCTLSSMAFRRRLRDLRGYSGRTSGRETWHAPGTALEPANGGPRCATR